ncbi:MAG: S8 family serine peptidase, partial [Clostridia bacterium]
MKKTQKSIIAVILTLALVLSQAFTVYGSNMVPQKDTNIVSADSVEELPSKGDKIVNKSEQEGVIPGKIMVKYKDYSSLRMMSGLNASDSAVSGKSIRNLNIIELEIADDADVLEAVDKLNADPNVEFAEPVYERRAVNNSTVVDSVYCEDEFYKKGWQWGLEAVNMDKMWGTVEEEYQSDIVIAVIDSGVDIDHSEFEGRIVNGYDFINVDNDPDDDYGHGTHVAGIAAAGNDGYGMAGVASKAKIMPIKVLDENGFGDTVSVVNGILYAINQGADVINLSFGGRSASQSEFLAIQYALDNGVVVVAAAGNDDSSSLDYPANYDGVISVGAADWNNAGFGMAEFSNYGSRIDMVAPGVDILSTIPEELDTRFDGDGDGDGIKDGYTLMSGTSMSTPFVSGMAAMLLAYSKQMDVNLEVGALNRCDTLLRMMKASAYEFSEYYLVNGSMDEGNINPPFMDKKLMLTASVLLEDDMVELFLKGSNYRNEPSDTIEDTFKAYMMPYSIDESGKRYFGIYEEVGEISLIDGEGNIEVPVEKGSNYLFFVEGNDAYLSAAVVGVEIPYNNGSFESALELQTGRGRYNKFNSRDEKHYYKFTTSPGEAAEYNIYSTGGTDVYVDLYNSDEQHVTYDDDGGIGWNFDMTRTLDADSIYYIKVGTYGVGEYGVVVEGGNADENTAD